MEESIKPTHRIDLIGTVLAALSLAVGIVVAFVASWGFGKLPEMFADAGTDELPLLTRIVLGIQRLYGLDLLALLILIGGIFLLVREKDRLRANLYAGLCGVMLLLLAALFFLAGFIPLVRMISMMGNAN